MFSWIFIAQYAVVTQVTRIQTSTSYLHAFFPVLLQLLIFQVMKQICFTSINIWVSSYFFLRQLTSRISLCRSTSLWFSSKLPLLLHSWNWAWRIQPLWWSAMRDDPQVPSVQPLLSDMSWKLPYVKKEGLIGVKKSESRKVGSSVNLILLFF